MMNNLLWDFFYNQIQLVFKKVQHSFIYANIKKKLYIVDKLKKNQDYVLTKTA